MFSTLVYCIIHGSVQDVDGTQNYGALIESVSVPNCGGNFTFPVDVYLGSVHLFVTAYAESSPTATVTDMNGETAD